MLSQKIARLLEKDDGDIALDDALGLLIEVQRVLDDPVAAVRAGVESGTIKGEVVEVTGDEIETDPVWLEQGQWLCIRLDKERPSDGGSET